MFSSVKGMQIEDIFQALIKNTVLHLVVVRLTVLFVK